MVNAKLFLGCGEVLWDLLPGGKQLGGAPINAAVHAMALGADAHPVSRVGKDALGDEILERLRALGMPTEHIAVDAEAPTGTVSVELAEGQPKFVIHENVAWDRMIATDAALALARKADVICFGTLAQRGEVTRRCIRALATAAPRSALRIFDVNLRGEFYSRDTLEKSLRLANVVKVNDEELAVLADAFKWGGTEEAQLLALTLGYDLRVAALTRGARGSALCFGDGILWEHPGIQSVAVDAVGAGDAFTAALAMGLLLEWDGDKINQHANEIAAYVVTQNGATPKLPEHLTSVFRG
jgi:fructokinase